MSHNQLRKSTSCLLLLAAVFALTACSNKKVADNISNAINSLTSVTANFTYAVQSPATIVFTNRSTGASSYAWTFGDGGTSVAENPTHTYKASGNYKVTLTATNKSGYSKSTSQNVTITIADTSATKTKKVYVTRFVVSKVPYALRNYYILLSNPSIPITTARTLYQSDSFYCLTKTSEKTITPTSKISLASVTDASIFGLSLYCKISGSEYSFVNATYFTGTELLKYPEKITWNDTLTGITIDTYFSYE